MFFTNLQRIVTYWNLQNLLQVHDNHKYFLLIALNWSLYSQMDLQM